MSRFQAVTYPEPMTFTVVRAVRETGTTTTKPCEKLHGTAHHAMPLRPAAMDLPCTEQLIRLEFGSGDFARTIPGGLS